MGRTGLLGIAMLALVIVMGCGVSEPPLPSVPLPIPSVARAAPSATPGCDYDCTCKHTRTDCADLDSRGCYADDNRSSDFTGHGPTTTAATGGTGSTRTGTARTRGRRFSSLSH